MATLREIYESRQDEALMDKLASVADAVGDNPEFVEALDSALDIVKEAGVTDPEDQLDAAVELAVAYLSGEGEDAGFDKEAAAEEAYELGKFAAFIAEQAGFDEEELSKIASDEEAEAFGRALAHACVEALED